MSTPVLARRKPGELPGCRARGHGLTTPLLWRDVDQRLVEHPLVPERVIDGGLPLAVLPVVLRVNQHRASGHSRLDHAGDVLDFEHHLVRSSALRRSPSGPNLSDHHLGRLPVWQAELRAMRFADADVFDKSEDLGVPRDRGSDISHRQHGGHASVGRRPVHEHPATLDRSGHRAQNLDGRPAPQTAVQDRDMHLLAALGAFGSFFGGIVYGHDRDTCTLSGVGDEVGHLHAVDFARIKTRRPRTSRRIADAALRTVVSPDTSTDVANDSERSLSSCAPTTLVTS